MVVDKFGKIIYWTKTCPCCGLCFETKIFGQKYCSEQCKKKLAERKIIVISKICLSCGQSFETPMPRQKYCSKDCCKMAQKNNPWLKRRTLKRKDKGHMTTVIGCPVQNRAWVLPYYLKHIYEIEYDKKDLVLWFLVNDSKDTTLQILEDFARLHEKEYNKIIIQDDFYGFHPDNRNKGRSSRFHQFTYVRNKWAEGLKGVEADWVFSVDSDILVPSGSLKKLISNNKDICSMLVNNMAHPRGYGKDCTNVLMKTATKYTHILEYPQDTVFECDVTGAAYLIKRVVFNNTLYQYHPQGEDAGFCINAYQNRYKIWCDSSLEGIHIMNDKILDAYKMGAINGL